MSDVQVSNARRIGFTAVALIAFWVLAWRAYSIGCDGFYRGLPVLAGPAFALVPWCLLSVSCGSSLRVFRDQTNVSSGVALAISMGFCCLWGYVDFGSQMQDEHVLSWLWLLLPIILTTAFVIFGAWRRAVRDAEVEVVGEGG